MPLGERAFKKSLMVIELNCYCFKRFFRVIATVITFGSVASLVFVEKNCSLRRSGVASFSISTLSMSNKKNGALGRSFLGSTALFLSLICSKLNIAYHFE